MASFAIPNANFATWSLAAGEFGIVTAAGSLTGNNPRAVTMTGGQMVVAGTVFGTSAAIDLTMVNNGVGAISIAATGVASGLTEAISLNGAGKAYLTNAGLITSQDVGIYADVDYVSIENTGDIVGLFSAGIRARSSDTVVLSNTGSIWGNEAAVYINGNLSSNISNGGMLSGKDGLFVDAVTATILNTGTISGTLERGVEAITSGAFYLSNTGTIQGATFGLTHGGGYATIENRGIITGQTGGLSLGDGDSFVRNSGTIAGEIVLNGGADTFLGAMGIQFVISAGDGNDYVQGGVSGEYIDAGLGDDYVRGGAGEDSLEGYAGLDTLYGGDGDDDLNGFEDNDLLFGGAGDDGLAGDVGNDTLSGGAGDDSLFGGAGHDRLSGGKGDDTMTGFTGADVFVFAPGNGADRITFFTNNVDRLDLRAFGYASFAALAADASDTAQGLLIDFSPLGGGTLVVTGMTTAMLSAADVLI